MLHVFYRLLHRHRLGPHSEKGAKEQDGGADHLSGRECLTENKIGKDQRAKRAEELKRLRERDPELGDRDIIKYMRHADAGHGGNNESGIYLPAYLNRCRKVPI